MMRPLFTHDCGDLIVGSHSIKTEWGCEFLGTICADRGDGKFILYDVWVHEYEKDGGIVRDPSVIMRYSSDGPEYASGPLLMVEEWARNHGPTYSWAKALKLVKEKKSGYWGTALM
jgi:hypothetical protein